MCLSLVPRLVWILAPRLAFKVTRPDLPRLALHSLSLNLFDDPSNPLTLTMISYPTLLTLLVLSASAVLGSGQESSSPISELGGPCDNGTRFSPRCGQDLTCWGTGRRPGSSGMCLPLAKVNEVCDGTARYPAKCGPEAKCVMPPLDSTIVISGGTGTCIAIPAKEGGKCGGPLKHRIPCKEGLTCQIFSMVVGLEVGPYGKCVSHGED